MKLNLGCGNHYAPGWINIDIESNDQVHPDVVADVTQPLPFVGVERIYAGHVLEHLAQADAVQAVKHWRDTIAADGEMMVVGPDCDRAFAMLNSGQLTADDYKSIRFGRGAWDHDHHLWRSTETTTAQMLQDAGWKTEPVPVESLVDGDYPLVSGIGWQFAIRCEP